MDWLRDRLAEAGPMRVAALVLGGAVLAGMIGLWYVRSLPRAVEAVPQVEAAEPQAGPTPGSGSVVVHVAGLVRAPGVYELPDGARVIDAIEAAGGAKKGADLSSLNLAAPLVDAQQVYVAKRGERPPPGGAAGGPPGAGEALINVNLATAEELQALPGIGPVLSERIVEHREREGPFRSVDDLIQVTGIGEKRLADIRERVTV